MCTFHLWELGVPMWVTLFSTGVLDKWGKYAAKFGIKWKIFVFLKQKYYICITITNNIHIIPAVTAPSYPIQNVYSYKRLFSWVAVDSWNDLKFWELTVRAGI